MLCALLRDMGRYSPLQWLLLTILLSCLLGNIRNVAASDPHERRSSAVQHSIARRRLDGDTVLPVRIAVKQNLAALANAEKWLMDVSAPDSPNYGQHWTQDQIIDAFSPSDEALRSVTDWLQASGITEYTHSDNKQWIAFDAAASHMESLLGSKYFAHTLDDGSVQAMSDEYYLPEAVAVHVDYVTPGLKGTHIKATRGPSKRSEEPAASMHMSTELEARRITDPNSLKDCGHLVTPACIRALYDFAVPDPNESICNNSFGIFAAGKLSNHLARSSEASASH